MPDPVIVIGAGHNGLVAAFYLARAGLDVLVLEAKSMVGGACVTEELIPGFKFSTCANIVCSLRPEIVSDMNLNGRGLDYSAPGCRVNHCYEVVTQLYAPGKGVTWWGDQDQMKAAIGRFSKKDVVGWDAWVSFWGNAARIFEPFVMRHPPQFHEVVQKAAELGLSEVLATVMTNSIAELADAFFESFELRNQIRVPEYGGSLDDVGTGLIAAMSDAVAASPTNAPPAPRGFVRGGMGALSDAMAAAAREVGVRIRTEAAVRQILVSRGRVVGVELEDRERIYSPLVVSNVDPKRTFGQLMNRDDVPTKLLDRVQNIRTRVAPLKFHCALTELPEFIGFPSADIPTRLNLVLYGGRMHWERAWDDAKYGRLPSQPIIGIFLPSIWDRSLAPRGKHTASFWIQFAPVHLNEGTWPERREEMADQLSAMINSFAPNFTRSIIDRVLLTPYDLEQREYLTDGNIHHVDIRPSQLLWRRPLEELSGYATPLAGLFLSGAGMHPYGEITGAPGHNAAQAVLRHMDAAGHSIT